MSTLYFDNRRLLAMTLLLILVAGLSSFYVLPRLEDPVLNQRIALINTIYPGASAERVEALVTEKIEAELLEIEETKELRSNSLQGVSTITVELHDWVTETDEVWSRVRDKLADARPELPDGILEPRFEELEVRAYGLILAVTWDRDEPPNYAIMRRYAEALEDQLRALSGTEDIDIRGDPAEEILVEIEPTKLASVGLTAGEVARQIEGSDAKVSAGQIRGEAGDFLLEVAGELDSLARISQIPIKSSAAGEVRLDQIAVVKKGIQQPASNLALINGKPAIALNALPRENVRVDLWSAEAMAATEAFAAELPRGLSVDTVFEQSQYVEERLNTLLANLVLGAAAVVVVIFFLMGWQSALIVGLSLPLSSLMVLTGMNWMGIPIHQMSVTGLIIALGLLIDNAIVMVDEVQGRLQDGATPREAVRQCISHLAVPLLGSTLTTCLAFAPIALMPGPAGEFVGSIALSVMLAVTSSFFLAMTVIPAVTAIAKNVVRGGQHHWWNHGISDPRLTSAYRWVLDRLFRSPALGIAVSMLLPVTGFVVASQLSDQFFPPTDRDQFQVEIQLPRQASLSQTVRTAKAARELLLEDADIEGVDWFLGQSAPSFYYNIVQKKRNTSSYAQAIIHLKEGVVAKPVIRRVQELLDQKLPAARTLAKQLEQGPPFSAPVEMRIYGPDLAVLRQLGDQMRTILSQTTNVTHTADSLSEPQPKLALKVDEEEARRAGLQLTDVARQLDESLEGSVGGSVLEATEELPVRVRVAGADRQELDNVASLDILPPEANRQGEKRIPLTAIAEVTYQPENSAISRFNNRRMNEVQSYVVAGVLPSDVVAEFRSRLAASDFELPPGYTMEAGGEAAKRDDAIGNLLSSVFVLMVLMVATLVLSFSSFRMAGLIGLVAVQSVGLGMLSLWLFGFPFGFMSIVGTMGLIGVAINDSIVVLAAIRDDADASRGDRRGIREVVIKATRHVLGTTLTTIAGFLPLILGGGGFWPPMAICIAGGVAGATLLALVFVPSAYLVFLRLGISGSNSQTTQQRESEEIEVESDRGAIALPR